MNAIGPVDVGIGECCPPANFPELNELTQRGHPGAQRAVDDGSGTFGQRVSKKKADGPAISAGTPVNPTWDSGAMR